MSRAANRNVQLVSRYDAERRISELPPELMANCGNLKRCRWFRSILDGVNHAGGGQKQNDYDQNRNDGPGQLNLSAAIYLGGLALIIPRAPAELDDGIRQQRKNDQKN